jgi:hypothetical protein
MAELRIKLNKKLKDGYFFKFVLFNNFVRNLALKYCVLYIVTPMKDYWGLGLNVNGVT